MAEAWESLMGLLLHDRDYEGVFLYLLLMTVVAALIIYGRLGFGDGGGDGYGDGDGGGGGDGC